MLERWLEKSFVGRSMVRVTKRFTTERKRPTHEAVEMVKELADLRGRRNLLKDLDTIDRANNESRRLLDVAQKRLEEEVDKTRQNKS